MYNHKSCTCTRTRTNVIQYKVQHNKHTVDALDGKNVTKKLGKRLKLLAGTRM